MFSGATEEDTGVKDKWFNIKIDGNTVCSVYGQVEDKNTVEKELTKSSEIIRVDVPDGYIPIYATFIGQCINNGKSVCGKVIPFDEPNLFTAYVYIKAQEEMKFCFFTFKDGEIEFGKNYCAHLPSDVFEEIDWKDIPNDMVIENFKFASSKKGMPLAETKDDAGYRIYSMAFSDTKTAKVSRVLGNPIVTEGSGSSSPTTTSKWKILPTGKGKTWFQLTSGAPDEPYIRVHKSDLEIVKNLLKIV